MPRAPFQVLVLPFTMTDAGTPLYAVFRRADLGVWQGLAGGGEEGESPEAAARREAWEEAGIAPALPLLRLTAIGQVPATAFRDRARWPAALQTIPEYAFAVAVVPASVRCSAEHDALEWLPYAAARDRLEWESNRIALKELHNMLTAAPAP